MHSDTATNIQDPLAATLEKRSRDVPAEQAIEVLHLDRNGFNFVQVSRSRLALTAMPFSPG
jgi:hypothetical protein